MSYALFLTHKALPGRRDELIDAWRRHMPEAIEGNEGHEAYVYCVVDGDPDALMVFQQYSGADAAQAFLRSEAYLTYLLESEHLLAAPPAVVPASPIWAKNVGN